MVGCGCLTAMYMYHGSSTDVGSVKPKTRRLNHFGDLEYRSAFTSNVACLADRMGKQLCTQ